jgi:hypothetical protein
MMGVNKMTERKPTYYAHIPLGEEEALGLVRIGPGAAYYLNKRTFEWIKDNYFTTVQQDTCSYEQISEDEAEAIIAKWKAKTAV